VRKVNIHEAGTMLPQLVEAAESGETVILTRAGKPVVELVALASQSGIRLGSLKGQIPEQLIRDIARPWSKSDVEALFGSGRQPRSREPGVSFR
jgi:prevent-host-death family protein